MFWENYESLCRDRGMAPSAVATAAKLAPSRASEWKKGAVPKFETAVRLAEVLDCDVHDLFTDDSAQTTVSVTRSDGRRLRLGRAQAGRSDTGWALQEDDFVAEFGDFYASLPPRRRAEFVTAVYGLIDGFKEGR